jgi:cytochrome c oxidase cbb3-type subunit 3
MLFNKKNSLLTVVALMLTACTLKAAETSSAGNDGYNTTLISLVSLILILLFVIGVLAGTLRQLTFVTREKMYKDKKDKNNTVKTLLLFVITTFSALAATAADVVEVAPAPAIQSIDGIPIEEFYVIISVIALELLVIGALMIFINVLLRIIRNTPEREQKVQEMAKKSWFWDNFNKAASLDKEQEVLLDHNYDGIQELDNSLPPWWKYGFYLTIVVGVIYIYRFHFSHDGMSQQEEYLAEMQQGEEDKAAYLAKSANNVDENTVVYLTDAASIAAGREMYGKSCVACHLADGGGSVGPNLTDEYWIHGGGIKDIFKTLKYGWQEKGMKSWKDDYSPKQLQEIASFVKSLKGTKSATPKEAQGEIYIEAGVVTAVADSSVAKEKK